MTSGARQQGTAARLRPSDWRIQVWRSFLRAHAGVMRELERELAAETGMPIGWYDVLLQLAEAPDRRLRMAELADLVLLSRSGLTRLVDRLQAEGLVRREPSKDDARGTYTVLTQAGFDRLRHAAPVHLDGVGRHWLAYYNDDELRQLGELLTRTAPPEPSEASESVAPPESAEQAAPAVQPVPAVAAEPAQSAE